MIIVTGAGGFIGTNLISFLCSENKILSVCGPRSYSIIKNSSLNIQDFINMLKNPDSDKWPKNEKIECIIHLGAITSTGYGNWKILHENNIEFSKLIWSFCTEKNIPLIYASSAAVYGSSSDFKEDSDNNYPLNKYGWSKYIFDRFTTECGKINFAPKKWYGLRFFNVYGQYESIKQQDSSIPFKFYQSFKNTNRISIFDTECKRDFIYVEDVIRIIDIFKNIDIENGIYNIGTGISTCVSTVAEKIIKIFQDTNKSLIDKIDFPDEYKDRYQHYTCADVSKLEKAIGKQSFTQLGIGLEKTISINEFAGYNGHSFRNFCPVSTKKLIGLDTP